MEYMHLSKWLYSSLIDKFKKYTPANRMQTWPQIGHYLYLIELITLKSSSQLFSQDGVKRLKSMIYIVNIQRWVHRPSAIPFFNTFKASRLCLW